MCAVSQAKFLGAAKGVGRAIGKLLHYSGGAVVLFFHLMGQRKNEVVPNLHLCSAWQFEPVVRFGYQLRSCGTNDLPGEEGWGGWVGGSCQLAR